MRSAMLASALLLWGALGSADELPPAYRETIRELRTAPDPTRRAWAALGLGQGLRVREQPGAHPEILTALEEASRLDADDTVRAMAAYGLCVLKDRRGVPGLITALTERITRGQDARSYLSPVARLPVPYMYRALARAGGAEATAFLIATAEGRHGSASLVSIWALGLLTEEAPEVDGALRMLARDADPAVREEAQQAIGRRRPPGRGP